MKKIVFAAAAVILILSSALNCFADTFRPAYVSEDFTVIWSEVEENGQYLLLYSDKRDLCEIRLSEDKEFEISLDICGDGSLKTDSEWASDQYENYMSGKRISAGTVLSVSFCRISETWPAVIEDFNSVGFRMKKTDMTVNKAEEIFEKLNKLNKTDRYGFINGEETAAGMELETLFTALDSDYDEKTGKYGLLISIAGGYYSVQSSEYKLSASTAEVTVTDGIASSDGSETGDMLLELYRQRKDIPAGSVVRLRWSGWVAESYPPSFMGITGIEFTSEKSPYSLEFAAREVENINEFCSGRFDVPGKEDSERFAKTREFTVAAYIPSENDNRSGTLYLADKSGDAIEFLRAETDTESASLLCEDGEAAWERYQKLLNFGSLPVGTVVEAVYGGISDCDCYPPLIDGLSVLTVTGRTSDKFTVKELEDAYEMLGIEKSGIKTAPNETETLCEVTADEEPLTEKPGICVSAPKNDRFFIYLEGLTVESDGSEKSDRLLENYRKTGALPSGTRLRVYSKGYFLRDGEDPKSLAGVRKAVIVSEGERTEIFKVTDSDGYKLSVSDVFGDVSVINTDFRGSKIKLSCTGEELRKTAEKFSKTGELPIGTVIKITYSGLNPSDGKIIKITVTDSK